MDFAISEPIRNLAAAVRRFVDAEVIPVERRVLERGFGAAGPETMGRWWAGRAQPNASSASEASRMAADKRRHEQAMAEALRRGLDAEERAAEAAKAKRAETRYTRDRSHSRNHGPWRSRPEFVRVLLAETTMSAKDIAAVAGVTIYDVFREKLLMRRPKAA